MSEVRRKLLARACMEMQGNAILESDLCRTKPSREGGRRSAAQEIQHQLLPVLRQKTLRMILHPLQRPALVADTHDLVIFGPGADLEIAHVERVSLDDQAVITCR